MLTGVLLLLEFFALFGIAVGIMAGYVGIDLSALDGLAVQYLAISAIGSAALVLFLQVMDGYQTRALRQPLRSFSKVVLGWSATFAFLLIGLFFLKMSVDFSRVWFGTWYLGGLTFLFFERLTISQLVRKWGRNGIMERRAVIVGGGKSAEKLIRSLEAAK